MAVKKAKEESPNRRRERPELAQTRVSLEEKQWINQAAEDAGLKPSVWIRKVLIEATKQGIDPAFVEAVAADMMAELVFEHLLSEEPMMPPSKWRSRRMEIRDKMHGEARKRLDSYRIEGNG